MSVSDLLPVRVDTVSMKEIPMLDVLRLDIIHPVISGNKWFKLKAYIESAKENEQSVILTFGGAYSNHIVATAAAAQKAALNSIGIIRGERPSQLSPSLQDAVEYGMKLFFISREEYRQKIIPGEIFSRHERKAICIINEGGYGPLGVKGAADILREINSTGYSHIICAVGTGTMLAGLITGKSRDQSVTGISVLKNNFSLQNEINELLPQHLKNQFQLIHEYHSGGYAKYNHELIDFMNEWFSKTGIPSDVVYTGKLFFAINKMISKNYFPGESRILAIHSGGLQGNRSLPNGTLIF